MLTNKQKWLFDLKKLQPGDLLFSRSKIVGAGIARMTGGRFGHVMLYLGDIIIHADVKGVWSKNPQRLLVNGKSRLAAFRLKSQLSQERLKYIEMQARARVGSLYSIPDAVNSLPLIPSRASDRFIMDRQFCSRLVAQIFAQAGVDLVSNFNYCTPSEITDSKLLTEIPDAVIKANDADIDLYESHDFNRQLQKETFRWLNEVRRLADKHRVRQINTQADVAGWILEYPQFDKEVCSYIKATKYLSFYDADRRNLPWRYNPQLMIEALMAQKSPIEAYRSERHQNNSNYCRIFNDRLIAIGNSKLGYEYFKLEESLLTKRLIEMVAWRDVLDFAGKELMFD